MRTRLALSACAALLTLVGASALAFETSYTNVARSGVVTIDPADPEIVFQIALQGPDFDVAIHAVESVAISATSQVPLPVTLTSSSTTSAGGVFSYAVDAATLCASGIPWIVVTEVKTGGVTTGAASRIVSCTP